MNEVTEEWVTKADNDFYRADLLLHSEEAFKTAGRIRKFVRNKLGVK